ncbi:uncharacterized protein [Montipora foliosa]|uniref:uncharacterized protein isoform X2 n=1 Tax=Montipora foliosa TaxID=591990 RepID=UPI0035F1B5A1
MAHGFSRSGCSLLPTTEAHFQGLTSKSVLVKNLSPGSTDKEVTIHFQRKGNGGGEVDCVRMLGEGVAVVTFERREVAQSVMKRRHEIDGCLLTLESFHETSAHQVFRTVSGRLDPDTHGLSFPALKNILDEVLRKKDIRCKEISDGFVLSGTLEQMKKVNIKLKNKLNEKRVLTKPPQEEFGQARVSTDPMTIPGPLSKDGLATGISSKQDRLKSKEPLTLISSKGWVQKHQTSETGNDEILSLNTQMGSRNGFKIIKSNNSVNTTGNKANLSGSEVKNNFTYGPTQLSTAEQVDPLSGSTLSKGENVPICSSDGCKIIGANSSKDKTDIKADLSGSETKPNVSDGPIQLLRAKEIDPQSGSTMSKGENLPMGSSDGCKIIGANSSKDRTDIKADLSGSETKPNVSDGPMQLSRAKEIDPQSGSTMSKGENLPMDSSDGCKIIGANSSKDKTNIKADLSGSETKPNVSDGPMQLSRAKEIDPQSGSTMSKGENLPMGSSDGCKIIGANSSKDKTNIKADLSGSETKPNVSDGPMQLSRAKQIDPLFNTESLKSKPICRGPAKRKCNEVNHEHRKSALKKCKSSTDNGDFQSPAKLLDDNMNELKTSSCKASLKKEISQRHAYEEEEEEEKKRDVKSEVKDSENVGREQKNDVDEENSREFVTSTGLMVKLFKGDICSQYVHVILCPANATLSYSEGLSKMILDKGGQAIKKECLDKTQNQVKLQEGHTFITSSGMLPCKVVFHAVLPYWNPSDKQEENKVKLCIHKCLKDGLTLSSGYRMESIAIPPLGQNWNNIPVEVSVEVVTRVLATFSKNIGPLHSGIRDVHIVCEDDKSLDEFATSFLSFSFGEETPFFKIVHRQKQDERTMRLGNESERYNSNPSLLQETSEEKTRKKISRSKTSTDEIITVEELQVVNSVAFDKGKNDGKEEDSLGCNEQEKQNTRESFKTKVCEKTISFVSCDSVQHSEVSMMKAVEILDVTSTGQLAEGTIDYKVVENKLLSDENTNRSVILNKNQERRMAANFQRGDQKRTTGINKQHTAHGFQLPKIKEFLFPKGDTRFRASNSQGILSNDTNWSRPRDEHELVSSFSIASEFITSPTIEGLLNADLCLGFQGLELSHEKECDLDRAASMVSSESPMSLEGMDIGLLSFDHTDEPHGNLVPSVRETEKSKECNSWSKEKRGLFKKSPGKAEEREDLLESREKERENKDERRCASAPKEEISILCALCQNLVDHPDLTHPNVCKSHKFCDDCLLNAFTFSTSCHACMDTTGLITVPKKKDTSSTSMSQQPQNQNQVTNRTVIAVPVQANQPPGEMMWKRYSESLPGFEGSGTIAVSFCFYGGIQSSEHPKPGVKYRGITCTAYIPDTKEGKDIFKLLRKAFDARLVFTILSSDSSGIGFVALNGIELKTAFQRNSRDGYPDPDYLSRLRQQLCAKGIH